MTMSHVAALYDREAAGWERNDAVLLSDFTARPFVMDLCEPIAGAAVLDAGCGEGYVARQFRRRGAAAVAGVDISERMIAAARVAATADPHGMTFTVGDAVDLSGFADCSFDLAVAVFLFNYVTIDGMTRAMREIRRVLRPCGRFVFSVPHPALAFVHRDGPPLHFDPAGCGYFSGRDHEFAGRMWRRDGGSVAVRSCHKTLGDYFRSLGLAGFHAMPDVYELGVTDAHLDLDRAFFEPLRDQPLHLALRIVR
jgi:SAM-dependent methyltransferase